MNESTNIFESATAHGKCPAAIQKIVKILTRSGEPKPLKRSDILGRKASAKDFGALATLMDCGIVEEFRVDGSRAMWYRLAQ